MKRRAARQSPSPITDEELDDLTDTLNPAGRAVVSLLLLSTSVLVPAVLFGAVWIFLLGPAYEWILRA